MFWVQNYFPLKSRAEARLEDLGSELLLFHPRFFRGIFLVRLGVACLLLNKPLKL